MRRRRTDTTNAAERERFELLFDRHRRAVLGYALRRVDEPADAADVLAETFLVAWRKLDDVPAGSAALPWLLAVARRVLANQRRGARRRGGLAERLRGELTAAIPRHGAVPAGDSEQGRLAAALARLPEADRELILLVGWEELEPSQIAVVLGIQPETVRTRLHRARARLREALAAEDAGAGAPAAAPASRSALASAPARAGQVAGEGEAVGTPPRSVHTHRPALNTTPTVLPLDAAVPRAAAPTAPLAPNAARAANAAPPARPTDPATPRPPHAPARRGGVPPLGRRPLTDLAKESLR